MLPVTKFKHANAMAANGVGTLIGITGSNLNVTYDPGFDPDRPSVYCQNHISMLDASVACQVIPRPFCGLMNHWHFRIPVYGWIMKATKGIPVFSRASGRTAEITDAARERVEQGVSILVFPEAHRTLDGSPREFRRGVFFMARDAGVPVVSLAVRGLYDVNRKGQLGFTPGEIEVYVGPQVDLEGLDDDGIADVATRMTTFAQKWVAEGVADSDALLERSA
ncbi:MAG: 1-acyl-sn-glycerol-3-phosphate acyltransferase [Bradymonadia bacterium]|jgi:1-acyl-sn-glycerol-3-phosphate acyltransferase